MKKYDNEIGDKFCRLYYRLYSLFIYLNSVALEWDDKLFVVENVTQ